MVRIHQAVLVVFVATPALSAAGPDDLLRAVPPNTNTLVLVNAKAAFASPLAKSELWAENYWKKYHSGIGSIPPEAQKVVIAADVNFLDMSRACQVGLVKMRSIPTVKEMARREGGTIDDVNDTFVVRSPRDVYFTYLTDTELAAIYPANRQALARWLKTAKANKAPELSPYLMKAVAVAETTPVVIALDLTDSLDPALIKLGLSISPTMVKHKTANMDFLSKFIARVKGLTFTAQITDKITGSIRLDFSDDTNRYKAYLRDLFIEFIEEQGIALSSLDKWEASFTETSMTLSGDLSMSDLRRILSLFAFPEATGEESEKGDGNPVSVGASKNYMAAVQSILKDLRKTRDQKAYEKTATWHDKAAEQIEHLNQRGVDPVALAAAREVSKRMRAIASSLRGVPIDMEKLNREAYYYSQASVGATVNGFGRVQFGVFGPTQVDTNYPQIQAEQAKVIADDEKRRSEAWSQIDRILTDARQKLTDKYKVPFE
jgi:hypothetical protein